MTLAEMTITWLKTLERKGKNAIVFMKNNM